MTRSGARRRPFPRARRATGSSWPPPTTLIEPEPAAQAARTALTGRGASRLRVRMRRAIPIAVVVLPALAACTLVISAARASSDPAPCAGSQLAGRFVLIPGSAGAGSVSYRLVLRNTSARECTLTGLPSGRLLDRSRRPLPTHVRAAFPGALTAVLVRLRPDRVARATARFSPDVPGTGEPVAPGSRNCEPTASWFQALAPGGGTTRTPVVPPTPVCEHGTLRFSAYGP